MFHGLEPQRCEDMKGIDAHEMGPRSFGTFENQCYCLSKTKGTPYDAYLDKHASLSSILLLLISHLEF